MRRWGYGALGVLVVANLALGGAAVLLASRNGVAAAPSPATCDGVVADFRRQFPEILAVAKNPSIECSWNTAAGAGGYSPVKNHAAVNTGLSATALVAGMTDKVAFWRGTLAHEIGHAYASQTGIDQRWAEYARIRGLAEEDPKVAVEDYAETFAWSLGWLKRCYAPSPYCFHVSAGRPDRDVIGALRSAGLLPRPRL